MGCGVRVIAEPGRYYVSSAFTLATCIIAKREVISMENVNRYALLTALNGFEIRVDFIFQVLNDASHGTMYYTNDGVYGSFNCLLFDHAAVQMKSLKVSNIEASYVIVFPTFCLMPICMKFNQLLTSLSRI